MKDQHSFCDDSNKRLAFFLSVADVADVAVVVDAERLSLMLHVCVGAPVHNRRWVLQMLCRATDGVLDALVPRFFVVQLFVFVFAAFVLVMGLGLISSQHAQPRHHN